MAVTAQARAPQVDATIAELKRLYGDRLTTAHAVREQHGKDISYHEAHPPDAVVFAESTEEVQAIVQLCARHKTPVIPFGAGTSLEGHISAPQRRRLARRQPHEQGARGQRGGPRRAWCRPASRASSSTSTCATPACSSRSIPAPTPRIGGMAATRASGTNAVRYGTMRENVLALHGRHRRRPRDPAPARRARKSAAGYDLTRLFVGSEGTLGVITEITLRLYGIPEAIVGGGLRVRRRSRARCNTVIQTIQMGIPVARIELLDALHRSTRSTRYSKLSLPRRADAAPRVPRHARPASRSRPRRCRRSPPSTAAATSSGPTRPEERSRLWKARHDALLRRQGAAARLRASGPPTSACRSRGSPNACSRRRRTSTASGLYAPIVGHVGDGNFHLAMLVDPRRPDGAARAPRRSTSAWSSARSRMDGTCTGEHGVGLGKIEFLDAGARRGAST